MCVHYSAFSGLSREDFGSVSGRNIDTVVSEGGIDTVLCIDLSGSVDDKAKEQVISVVSDFLTGIQVILEPLFCFFVLKLAK